MPYLTIPIPDDLDELQQAELEQWLCQKAAEASPNRLPCEDDPQWQAETARRIRAGMDDIKAGRHLTSQQVRQQLADHLRSDASP